MSYVDIQAPPLDVVGAHGSAMVSGFTNPAFVGPVIVGRDFSGRGQDFSRGGQNFSGRGQDFPGSGHSRGGRDFSGRGQDFPGSDFPGGDFPGGDFPGGDFPGSDFPGSDLDFFGGGQYFGGGGDFFGGGGGILSEPVAHIDYGPYLYESRIPTYFTSFADGYTPPQFFEIFDRPEYARLQRLAQCPQEYKWPAVSGIFTPNTRAIVYRGGNEYQTDLLWVRPISDRWGKPVQLQAGVAWAFWQMQQAALADGVELNPNSGFRTMDEQEALYEEFRTGERTKPVARPGHSNHQAGMAVDIQQSHDPRILRWLRANARGPWPVGIRTPSGEVKVIEYRFLETVRGEPWHWAARAFVRAGGPEGPMVAATPLYDEGC